MNESGEAIDFQDLQEIIGVSVDDVDNIKLYFREIYKDLVLLSKSENNPPYVSKLTFIEYINLPIIIAEKLFNSFDKDQDGFLNLKEFSKNLVTLYTGTFEQICKIIFCLLDFNHDGIIIPEDVKLLMQYLPLSTQKEYKFQMASLSEISQILVELFQSKTQLKLEEFIDITENNRSDAFLQILCFLYERKPFSESVIKFIKKKHKSQKFQSKPKSKLRFYSPKKSIPSPNRKSILSPLRLLKDLDNRKTPGKVVLEPLDNCPDFDLDGDVNNSKVSSNNAEEVVDKNNVYGNTTGMMYMSQMSKLNYSTNYSDYLYKVTNKNKLKKFYVVLTGKDMFYFKNKNMWECIGMHHLSGCNISSVTECLPGEVDTDSCFQFTIHFKNTNRVYYAKTKISADAWHKNLVSAIGNLDIHNYYEMKKDLGEGKFGLVKLCENKTTKFKVAVKIISRDKTEESDMRLIYNELEIMKIVSHPNIVSLIDLFETDENIFIVMDYYKGGDLTSYLDAHNGYLTEQSLAKLMCQICKGIKYLHEYGIVHRDLKPDNIMLSDKSEEPVAKIMDFGLSAIMGVKEKAEDGFGTLSFVAPEVLLRKPYNREVDIWSIGVMIYYCLTGTLPFDDENDNEEVIAKKIVFGNVKFPRKYWMSRSEEVKDLIRQCLIKEPDKRIKIKDVLEHKWLKMFNQN